MTKSISQFTAVLIDLEVKELETARYSSLHTTQVCQINSTLVHTFIQPCYEKNTYIYL